MATTTFIDKATNVNDVVTQTTQSLCEDDLKEVAIERLKWANRRQMAWVFTYAAVAFSFLILLCIVIGTKEIADRITYATDLLTWLFMGLLSIVGMYFGGTIIEKFSGTTKKPV